MTKKSRCLFTDDQKAEAVNIVKQSGKLVNQVAKEMGLTESDLRKWVKQSLIDEQPRIESELTSAEQQELAMLRHELKRVKMERDFLTAGASSGGTPPTHCLKKAATFFARESSDLTS
jgi:transposase